MKNLKFFTYDGYINVRCDQVMYFEADDHYCHVYYYSGYTFMLSFGLSAIESSIVQLLGDDSSFQRMGRKYIVNKEFVHQINTMTHSLSFIDASANKIVIKIPKTVLREFISSLQTGG